jgi:hypothetical protein
MAARKPSGQEPGNRSEIDPKNAIGVEAEDLPEEDQCQIREEMRCDLEEVEVAKMHEKLSCYQKTRAVSCRRQTWLRHLRLR